jgi:hypothetical protein
LLLSHLQTTCGALSPFEIAFGLQIQDLLAHILKQLSRVFVSGIAGFGYVKSARQRVIGTNASLERFPDGSAPDGAFFVWWFNGNERFFSK